MFSSETWEIFKSTCFEEHFQMAGGSAFISWIWREGRIFFSWRELNVKVKKLKLKLKVKFVTGMYKKHCTKNEVSY